MSRTCRIWVVLIIKDGSGLWHSGDASINERTNEFAQTHHASTLLIHINDLLIDSFPIASFSKTIDDFTSAVNRLITVC